MTPDYQNKSESQETAGQVLASTIDPAEKSKLDTGKSWKVGTLVYGAGGLAVLFFWLLWGDFAWSLKERSIGQVLQIMLIKFGSSDTLMGWLLISIPAAIAMFVGPIVGYKSDRHRGRWGRRIPFILAPLPLVVFAMLGLAFSPAMGQFAHQALGLRTVGSNGCILTLMAFFWMVFAFSSTVLNTVFGALIKDVVPDSVLGRFYGAFRALSLAAGMTFSWWIFGHTKEHFVVIFMGIGLVYGVTLFLMCMNVKEGEYPLPPPLDPSRGRIDGFIKASAGFFKACFGNQYYLLLFFVMAAPACVFVPFNQFAVRYAESLHMDMVLYGHISTYMYAISFTLAYPIGMLADRIHPLRIGIVGLMLYGLISLWGGIFVHDVTTFEIAFIGCGVIVGIFMTGTASLGQKLLPGDKFAEYSSAVGIVCCLSQIVLGPTLGWFLDYTHHVYRYVFWAGLGLTLLCLWAAVIVHRKFMNFGGPEHYIAPQ